MTGTKQVRIDLSDTNLQRLYVAEGGERIVAAELPPDVLLLTCLKADTTFHVRQGQFVLAATEYLFAFGTKGMTSGSGFVELDLNEDPLRDGTT